MRNPLLRYTKKTVAALVSVAIASAPIAPAFAANHPNSHIEQVSVVNLVANVDWDYDADAPDQVGTPKAGTLPTKLTKDYITAIMREFARTQFIMTEGRHRIGKIYIYKNGRFGENVDFQLINKDGRSNASAASWAQNAGTSTNFLSGGGRARDLFQVGRVIAHENGHYMYGLYDEYREAGKAFDATQPSSPADQDFAKATLMNNQNKFTRLSLPSDYLSGNPNDQNQTAQARTYATDQKSLTGGSAWEVLARDPSLDPNPSTRTRRILFDAFKGMSVPQTESNLTKYVKVLCNGRESNVYAEFDCGDPAPSETYTRVQLAPEIDRVSTFAAFTNLLWQAAGGSLTQDATDGAAGSAFANFKVIWADSPAVPPGGGAARTALSRTVLMLDTSLTVENIGLAVTAAQAIVNNATESEFIGLALSSGSSAPLMPLTQTNSGGKAALLAALTAYVPTVKPLDLKSAYNAVLPALQNGAIDGDANNVTLITYPGTAVQASLAETARTNRIPINAVTLQSFFTETNRALIAQSGGHDAAGQIPIESLSQMSGGHPVTGRTVADAAAKAAMMEHQAKGENMALVVSESARFVRAESRLTSFSLNANDRGVVNTTWYFDPHDAGKLSFGLISPSGRTITNVAAGSDPAGGHVTIKIDNTSGDQVGKWTATVQANAATDGEVDLDVISPTKLNLQVQISGQDRDLAPIITAIFAGEKPVSHANVTAQVLDAKTGAIIKNSLVLLDDGTGLDQRANDGTYTLDLAKLLPAGDYIIKVSATTTDASMFEDGNLIFASAPRQECVEGGNCDAALSTGGSAVPVGAGLSRIAFAELALSNDSIGVIPGDSVVSSNGSFGGGCTVASNGKADTGLLLLIGVAVAGLVLRRRRAGNNSPKNDIQ